MGNFIAQITDRVSSVFPEPPPPLPNSDTPDSRDSVASVWEFKAPNGWIPYHEGLCQALDSALPGQTIQNQTVHNQYAVTKTGMDTATQMDTATGWQRDVRRRKVSVEVDVGILTDYIWEFQDPANNTWTRCPPDIGDQVEDSLPGETIRAEIGVFQCDITKTNGLMALLTNLKTQEHSVVRRVAVASSSFGVANGARWEANAGDGWYPYPSDICSKISALAVGQSIPYTRATNSYTITRLNANTVKQRNTHTDVERDVRLIQGSRSSISSTPSVWEIDLTSDPYAPFARLPDWSPVSSSFSLQIDQTAVGDQITRTHGEYEYTINKVSNTRAVQTNCRTKTRRNLRMSGGAPDPVFTMEEGKINEEATGEDEVRRLFYEHMPSRQWRVVSVGVVEMGRALDEYLNSLEIVQGSLLRVDVERKLWHGAPTDVIQDVLARGFLQDHNREYAYGTGIYFGATSRASHLYTRGEERQMIFARVIVGDMVLGRSYYDRPPTKFDGLTEYDCMVDNVGHPRVFVVSKDYRAVPEYIVTYKRQ